MMSFSIILAHLSPSITMSFHADGWTLFIKCHHFGQKFYNFYPTCVALNFTQFQPSDIILINVPDSFQDYTQKLAKQQPHLILQPFTTTNKYSQRKIQQVQREKSREWRKIEGFGVKIHQEIGCIFSFTFYFISFLYYLIILGLNLIQFRLVKLVLGSS